MPTYIWIRDGGEIHVGECVSRQDAVDHCREMTAFMLDGKRHVLADHHWQEPEFFVVYEPWGDNNRRVTIRQLIQQLLATLPKAG
jgi:hypothetical protein